MMNLPNKKYNIIYADPPWTFKTWSNKGKGKSAEQHYDCMTVAFTWVKRNKKANSWFTGMGYYTRSNAEIAILGTRGKVLERANKNVPQVCDERIMEHSHKPDVIRQRIVDLFGDISRIELFARQKTKDWDVWGNEVNNYPKDRG